MKRTYLVLALLSSGISMMGAELPKEVAPAPKSFLDGVYVESLGLVRKPNFTDKAEYGAGVEVGLHYNKHVSVGVLNTAYETGNWGGSAIDETSGMFHYTLFSGKKNSLGGVGSVTHSWRTDAWALGLGVEAKHYFTKNISAGIGATVRFWNNGADKEDLLVFGNFGFDF